MKMASGELFHSEFPLYCIFPLSKGKFCVTGGGGNSKTGIPNALEVWTLTLSDEGYTAKCIFHHDMGTEIIMNSVTQPNDFYTLAASIGHSCHVLRIAKDQNETSRIEDLTETGKMFVEDVASVRTDYNNKDSYQKVVCFTHDSSRILTGGTDGIVRVWKAPDLKELYKLRSHTDEVEAIACHPSKLEAVSVCRAGDANAWNISKGKQLKRFNWGTEMKPKYRFRTCCFAPASGEGQTEFLFSINVPMKWEHRAKKDCYLIKWNPSTWKTAAVCKAGKHLLSALAVNSLGTKIAVGSTEGSVAIYSNELNLLNKVTKAHSFFVTSLSFVAASGTEGTGSSKQKEHSDVLLSVSADRTCFAMTSTRRGGGYCSWQFIFFYFIPFLTFLLSMALLWILVV